jgi:PADRE domain
MGNTLRCCLACLLPCGAFDMIRIVHLNGQIDEYNHSITVREILAANPNHIVSWPCSQGRTRHIMIVSPESELKRGQIYFLIPASTVPEKRGKRHKKRSLSRCGSVVNNKVSNGDNYLAEILSEGKRAHHLRRSIRGAVWRPNLESIPEES